MREIYGAVFLGILILSPEIDSVRAQDATSASIQQTRVGDTVEVTAGQEFYYEIPAEFVPAYRLDRTFKSTMPGAMGFRFGFEINSPILVRVAKTSDGWEYYIPEERKFKAYHSLLGSVIRGRDTVGLRISPDGRKEWFVDNSSYYGKTAIWYRPVGSDDPSITKTNKKIEILTGDYVEKLIYLGLTEGHSARIRFEKITRNGVLRDEFTFPLDKNGAGQGAVRGAEFTIDASNLRAKIKIVKSMAPNFEDLKN